MTAMPTRGRARSAAVAVAALTLLLAGTGAIGASARDNAGDEVRYVALGDSYTAGPFIPHQIPDPPGCRRSDRNYPHLAAAALGATLHDVSCSGATTADMAAPQPVPGGANPPQLAALDPSTDVVTIGVGGNDIGFSDIVRACVAVTPLGRPCQDRFAGGGPGGDEITRRIADAAPRLAAVLGEIRRRAPAARVFAVGYPAILPDHGLGCWPVMPFAFADVPYLRAKQKELNAMIAAQAATGGATYVDTYGPSIGHDACALPGVRWVEPVVPLSPAAPVHPNAAGMRGMAAVVATAVDATTGAPAAGPAVALDVEIVLAPGAP